MAGNFVLVTLASTTRLQVTMIFMLGIR